jgi:hypothetical protein
LFHHDKYTGMQGYACGTTDQEFRGMGRFNRLVVWVIALSAWGSAVAAGSWVLMKYETTAGRSGKTVSQWPIGSIIPLAKDRYTLVMFAHPKCPCTRASIEGLNGLMARRPGRLSVYVLFYRPSNYSESWTQSDFWRSARSIHTLQVAMDSSGIEAKRFGARTSGHTFVFDPQGRMWFTGGITAARGVQGDNSSLSAVEYLTLRGPRSLVRMPVYGCDIFGDEASPRQ